MRSPRLPYLRQTANSKQLIVNDEPFLMLAGELQNSSFSSPEYMKDVWANLAAMNINTVLGAIAWEQIEPLEDRFDFESLDKNILEARSHGLHLVLLWFGSFKNGTNVLWSHLLARSDSSLQVFRLTLHHGSSKTLKGFQG